MAESDPFRGPRAEALADEARQRAKRDSLFLLTVITRANGEPLGQAKVRNLSATGLMADCDRALEKGDRVMVELRGVGQVAGSIAWAHNQRVGVAFDHPIDPQQARKPVHVGPADDLPPYLRHLNRAPRFTR